MRRALILHNSISASSNKDELDVFDQAELIESALKELGYQSQRFEFNIHTNELAEVIKNGDLSVVFNLVESINDSGRMSFVAPALLELFSIPFTGSNAQAIYTTTDKVICKTILRMNNIATPAWAKCLEEIDPKKIYLSKPISEDGSVGIDDALVIPGSEITMIPHGSFVEEYIDGREFNISILGGENGYIVLPPAEMCFLSQYYETNPRILGYKAKWDENSIEYLNTSRNFNFEPKDNDLIEAIKGIAARCWELFGLRGYARVDLRVDKNNIPQVIEINANPCIAPDSGFIAACHKAGLTNKEIIRRIITDTKNRE